MALYNEKKGENSNYPSLVCSHIYKIILIQLIIHKTLAIHV